MLKGLTMIEWNGFEQFLAMGGYAAYVWSAFGLSFFTIFLVFIYGLSQFNQIKKQVKNYQPIPLKPKSKVRILEEF